MNIRAIRFVVLFAVLVLTLAVASVPAKADSFEVSLNTSSLSGTQILAFGLVNGGGGVNNSVVLSDFTFGGGAPVPPANYLGTSGVSGDLGSSIAMNDSGGTALFDEQFNSGSSISFLLTTTNNFGSTTPDAFAMYVCDVSLNCYSDDATTGALLVLNLTGGTLTPASFSLIGANAQGLPAPVVAVAAVPTPEPGSILLLGLGLSTLLLGSRKHPGVVRKLPPQDR